MLVISNRPRASRSSDFEITRVITPWIVLHSVQLLLLMLTICIDIIRGRQQITIYLYPFYVPILVYTLFLQVSTDYGTH